MKPVQGHPSVWAEVVRDPYGGLVIHCWCRYCGDDWRHRCDYPQRVQAWIDRYCAQHAHGDQAVRQHFFRRYDAGLHALHRGQ